MEANTNNTNTSTEIGMSDNGYCALRCSSDSEGEQNFCIETAETIDSNANYNNSNIGSISSSTNNESITGYLQLNSEDEETPYSLPSEITKYIQNYVIREVEKDKEPSVDQQNSNSTSVSSFASASASTSVSELVEESTLEPNETWSPSLSLQPQRVQSFQHTLKQIFQIDFNSETIVKSQHSQFDEKYKEEVSHSHSGSAESPPLTLSASLSSAQFSQGHF